MVCLNVAKCYVVGNLDAKQAFQEVEVVRKLLVSYLPRD
jgi:hypothetical protein